MANESNLYIGVMSGTSMDSVDVALCEIDGTGCRLLSHIDYPFDKALKKEILGVIEHGCSLDQLGSIDHRLGELFGDAVNALMFQEDLHSEMVRVIGLHGQTLWHAPDSLTPFSMQLGDPNIVTTKTDIPVVADFRRKDIALGGQGAPFAPAFHQFLFQNFGVKTAVVNIGGMANVSFLGDELIGYDTGPGNVLLDGWYDRHHIGGYDIDAQWSQQGSCDEALLEAMLSEPYFTMSPPKSTGREQFNMAWLEMHLQNRTDVKPEDIQATLVELTARTIADEVLRFNPILLLVCGGGVRNPHIMARLKSLLSETEVASTDSVGVDSQNLEAMAFAWLAYKRIHAEPVELSTVTGAASNGILGGLYG